MGAQEAVSAKRFHSQWKPDVITMEEGVLDEASMVILQERGHKFLVKEKIANVNAIKRLADGKLEGGADSRRNSKTEGY